MSDELVKRMCSATENIMRDFARNHFMLEDENLYGFMILCRPLLKDIAIEVIRLRSEGAELQISEEFLLRMGFHGYTDLIREIVTVMKEVFNED